MKQTKGRIARLTASNVYEPNGIVVAKYEFILLERVNPSPSPTHLARQSEWAKAEVVLNAATQCLRETELIRVVT
ncbi:hypothetical protein H5410_045066 [Solanum commersonii]|uniref:Uncharacterized protein n=1 Tax=Solanum commersonii TaxID=4109 RepID=A0A9J5XCM6_SOLCO|nr:hypothetical protein H5410_045066 [Solanum commersonii]